MTKEILNKIPKLYSQEKNSDPTVYVKFFCPWNHWTWYATEFDGEDTFFGWVYGDCPEYGYFCLSELEGISGFGGLKIERDLHFSPKPMSECKKQHGER